MHDSADNTHRRTQPFNGTLPRTAWVSPKRAPKFSETLTQYAAVIVHKFLTTPNLPSQASQSTKYEGHSISKLQNGVILLIFKMSMFLNIRFVRELILSTSCEFYYDDVTVTLFINIKIRQRYC